MGFLSRFRSGDDEPEQQTCPSAGCPRRRTPRPAPMRLAIGAGAADRPGRPARRRRGSRILASGLRMVVRMANIGEGR